MNHNITLLQIGGMKVLYMLGTSIKNCLCYKDSLIITGIKNAKFIKGKKINSIKITLNSLDLYNLYFINKVKITPKNYNKYLINNRFVNETILECIESVYCDQLKEIIEQKTGLYLTL